MTERRTSPPIEDRDERQRLDKWLWYARVVKTRALGSRLVEEGRVRVNGERIVNPARRLRLGDVLTISLPQDVRVLRLRAPGSRRGPFVEARELYEDLSRGTSSPES